MATFAVCGGRHHRQIIIYARLFLATGYQVGLIYFGHSDVNLARTRCARCHRRYLVGRFWVSSGLLLRLLLVILIVHDWLVMFQQSGLQQQWRRRWFPISAIGQITTLGQLIPDLIGGRRRGSHVGTGAVGVSERAQAVLVVLAVLISIVEMWHKGNVILGEWFTLVLEFD